MSGFYFENTYFYWLTYGSHVSWMYANLNKETLKFQKYLVMYFELKF